MLQIATLSASNDQHPLEEHLHQQLAEYGYTIAEQSAANVLICMGTDIHLQVSFCMPAFLLRF